MRSRLTLVTLAMLLSLSAPAFLGSPAGTASAALVTPSFATYAAPSTLTGAGDAGEPTVGVSWNTGAVMYQSYTNTYRVTFDDTKSPPAAAWVNAKSPVSVFNVDPLLFGDSQKGRTYAGGLDGSCSVMSFTDNDGASWTPMGNVCAGAAFDHPTLGSGPWTSTLPHVYDRSVYYCAQLSVVQCAVSQDGGLTFGAGVSVPCGGPNPGLHGSVAVGPNGYAYLPFRDCGGVNGVAVTMNDGLTWASRPIPSATSPANGFDPDVATTKSGWAYVGYPTSGYGVGVALTKDAGASWTDFGDVASAAGIRSSTFHEMVAGDDDRAAVAYLGSTTDGNPHDGKFSGVWHAYVTYTFNGGQTWTTVKTGDNVVQRGWICADGTTCGGGRNLLDFIDAQIDKQGRVVVAYADGCIGTCETGSGGSGASYATIARQSGGSGLFAAYDPSGPGVPAAPGLSGTAGEGSASLTWTTPSDGGDPITGYKVYRDGALLATVGLVNSYTDATVTNGKTYAYQVSAVNGVGEGGKSNTVSLTPRVQTPPSAPQSLTASHAGGPKSGKIDLAWQAPADDGGSAVTGYKVYRGTTSGGETYLTTVGNVLSWQDTGRAQGVRYYYKVTALNANGESAFSNEASALG